MTNIKVPDQLIPTLNEVVPLEGARSISVEELLNISKSLIDEIKSDTGDISAQGINALQKTGPPSQANELADAVLQIVMQKLVKILPDLMRQAVDEVLSQESNLSSEKDN